MFTDKAPHPSTMEEPANFGSSCRYIADAFERVKQWVQSQASDYLVIEQDLRLRIGATQGSNRGMPPAWMFFVIDFHDLVAFAIPTLDEPLVLTESEEKQRLRRAGGLSVALLGLSAHDYPLYLARPHSEEYELFVRMGEFQRQHTEQAVYLRAVDIARDKERTDALTRLDRDLEALSNSTVTPDQRRESLAHISSNLHWIVAQMSGRFDEGLDTLRRLFMPGQAGLPQRVTSTRADGFRFAQGAESMDLSMFLPDEENVACDRWIESLNAVRPWRDTREKSARLQRDKNLHRDANVLAWVAECNRSISAARQTNVLLQDVYPVVLFISSANNIRQAAEHMSKVCPDEILLRSVNVDLDEECQHEWRTILHDGSLEPGQVSFYRDTNVFRAYLALLNYKRQALGSTDDGEPLWRQMLQETVLLRQSMCTLVQNTTTLAAIADHFRVGSGDLASLETIITPHDLRMLVGCVQHLDETRKQLETTMDACGILPKSVSDYYFPKSVPISFAAELDSQTKEVLNKARRSLNMLLEYFKNGKKDEAELKDLIDLELITLAVSSISLEVLSKHIVSPTRELDDLQLIREAAYFRRFTDFPYQIAFKSTSLRNKVLTLSAICGLPVTQSMPASERCLILSQKSNTLKKFIDDLNTLSYPDASDSGGGSLERLLAYLLLLMVDQRDSLLISLVHRLFPAAPERDLVFLRDVRRFQDSDPGFYWETRLLMLNAQRLELRRNIESLTIDKRESKSGRGDPAVRRNLQIQLQCLIHDCSRFYSLALDSESQCIAPYRFLSITCSTAIMHRRLFDHDCPGYGLDKVIADSEMVFQLACRDSELPLPQAEGTASWDTQTTVRTSIDAGSRHDYCNVLAYSLALKGDANSIDRAHDLLHREGLGSVPANVLRYHILHTRAYVHHLRYERIKENGFPREMVVQCLERAIADYRELKESPRDPESPENDWIWRESGVHLNHLLLERVGLSDR